MRRPLESDNAVTWRKYAEFLEESNTLLRLTAYRLYRVEDSLARAGFPPMMVESAPTWGRSDLPPSA
jgi:hypothetical protein